MAEREKSKETMGTMKMNDSNDAAPSRRARRIALLVTAAACLATAVFAAPAMAAFGISSLDGTLTDVDGSPTTQAASHPDEITTTTAFNTISTKWGEMPDASVKDVFLDLAPGFVGNPTTVSQCTEYDLAGRGVEVLCPESSQIGTVELRINVFAPQTVYLSLFNMVPPPGKPSSFGFSVFGVPVHLYSRVRSDGDYGLSVDSPDINQTLSILSVKTTVWGVPADPSHDAQRCQEPISATGVCVEPASADIPVKAFLTNVTNCSAGPARTSAIADSWLNPGLFDAASFVAHDDAVPPNPVAPDGCNAVPFSPSTTVVPTSDRAESPTGLNFDLEIPSTGIENPTGLGQSHVKKATVTLPEGMTINPSAGEGLGSCSPAQFNSETATSPQGAGCPNDSKVGTVKIETPLLDEEATGALYIAKQNDNPFNSLLALYIVAKIPERGVVVKVAGKVTPDPKTGQLTTTFDNLPQLPFSKFSLSFREGQRSPLSTPRTCGTYAVRSEFVPWSAADPDNPLPSEIQTRYSEFKVTKGVGGDACSGGTPPFKPGLIAGTRNNAAGSYSPFDVRLTRNDGEQEFTRFSIKLPPGIIGKLAGVPYCSDAAIAEAKAKSGSAEQQSPSCPAASEVGRTLVGAGVGSVLVYVPGKVYLAGPYNGAPLSVVSITSAKVGPFDIGTVAVRLGLKVDPETAEVFVDGVGSDQIPHIIQGIPVHARDIRVYMDRPEFVINPTSCERTSTASTVLGSGLDFASDFDDVPVTVTSPFQAADCANLGFKPKLALSLKGGTKRGATPAFKAVLTARKGDANIGEAQVTLPRSEFLEQAHIKTICTRVQFKAGNVPGEKCPAASIYGRAKAITPILDEPLQGPVYLRSSSNKLPDLVAALNNKQINIALAGRIDSVEGGRIRNTFETVPDAPVTKFTLEMFGGKKSLLTNSTDLCKRPHRAIAAFTGQNGKLHEFNPVLKASCKKAKKKKARR
ncbi:MAG TPA: hypothetical protein VFX85_03110 [Solirubrobacterales bacterium]|nr:hypothetical protein [Solirubrobacterales bacterium]